MANYSKEFKEEAIRLAEEIGNKKAAEQLGISYSTLAGWHKRAKHKPNEAVTMSEEKMRIRNRELERENVELRKANTILKDALYFSPKTARGKATRTTRIRYEKLEQISRQCHIPHFEDQRTWLLQITQNRKKLMARKLLSIKIQAILYEHSDNDNYGVK